MSISVVDLNEEAKEEQPAIETVEEEPTEIANEVVEETAKGSLNTETVETNEEQKEEPKEEATPKPKAKPKASDIVKCDKCDKPMSYKNLRYSHKCSPEPKPVKPHAKPKAKQKPRPTPKPAPEVYYSDNEEEVDKPLSKPVRNQILKPQPTNPVNAIAQHYQLLQQQMIKQKQEKYNNLCQSIFSSKSKRR